jgi:hypothetical protein
MSKGGALSTVSRKRLIGPLRFFLYRRRLVQTGCQFPLTVALLFIRFRLNANLLPSHPNTHRFFRNHAHKQRVFGLVPHHTSTFAPRGLAQMHDSLFLGAVLLSCNILPPLLLGAVLLSCNILPPSASGCSITFLQHFHSLCSMRRLHYLPVSLRVEVFYCRTLPPILSLLHSTPSA